MAEQTVSLNRKARHDYQILETWEAGLQLTGTEIKSIRLGRVNLQEAYVRPEAGEVWLIGCHVGLYPAAGPFNHDPIRKRRLLLHRDQIREMQRSIIQRGLTIVPLRLYLKDGRAKLEIGLARGRKAYDKRAVIAQREAERQMQRALRHRDR